MAINYVTKHAPLVDEAFTRSSITDIAVNHDYEWVGAKTIKVHSVPAVAQTDYARNGSNRYGNPSELEDTVQEMTVSKDRAFTFTVDKMNSEEDQALNAGKALRRQIDQVVIPEVDKYRLAVMTAGAGVATYGDYATQKPYERLIDISGEMSASNVPEVGRIAYVSNAFYKGLKLDDNFIEYAKLDQQKLVNGQIGDVDGMAVIRAAGRMPAGVDCIIAHPIATTAAFKLSEYKQHSDPPGLSGVLTEGRNVFDAFVRENKRMGLAVHRSALMTLTVTNAAGASGKTKFTAVTGHTGELGVPYGKLVYIIAASPTAPTLGADISNTGTYPELALDADIACTANHKYIIALKDRHGKCIATSGAAVTCERGA